MDRDRFRRATAAGMSPYTAKPAVGVTRHRARAAAIGKTSWTIARGSSNRADLLVSRAPHPRLLSLSERALRPLSPGRAISGSRKAFVEPGGNRKMWRLPRAGSAALRPKALQGPHARWRHDRAVSALSTALRSDRNIYRPSGGPYRPYHHVTSTIGRACCHLIPLRRASPHRIGPRCELYLDSAHEHY